jgi:hypothetical protein
MLRIVEGSDRDFGYLSVLKIWSVDELSDARFSLSDEKPPIDTLPTTASPDNYDF